ncbi:MAG: hypothetical protein ACRC9Y_17675 [Aeromonas veronii]
MFKRSNPSTLQAQLEKMTSNGSFEKSDEGSWSLTIDKAGNGQARIRFLPSRDDNSTPFVKIYNHGFKVNNRWFIENCPTTMGQGCECPVCKANSELWNSGIEADKEVARQRKRKLSYWANILVVRDPANPDNDGKVFKYRFGQKIMDKIQAMIAVDTEMGETPVDVTCVFDGADFMLKTKKVSGFQNYDESKFFAQAELPKINDQAFQKFLMDSMHDLNKIVAPDQFKSEDELMKLFKERTGAAAKPAASATDDFDKQMAAYENTPVKAAPAAAATAGFDEDLPWDQDAAVAKTSTAVVDDDLDALMAELG